MKKLMFSLFCFIVLFILSLSTVYAVEPITEPFTELVTESSSNSNINNPRQVGSVIDSASLNVEQKKYYDLVKQYYPDYDFTVADSTIVDPSKDYTCVFSYNGYPSCRLYKTNSLLFYDYAHNGSSILCYKGDYYDYSFYTHSFISTSFSDFYPVDLDGSVFNYSSSLRYTSYAQKAHSGSYLCDTSLISNLSFFFSSNFKSGDDIIPPGWSKDIPNDLDSFKQVIKYFDSFNSNVTNLNNPAYGLSYIFYFSNNYHFTVDKESFNGKFSENATKYTFKYDFYNNRPNDYNGYVYSSKFDAFIPISQFFTTSSPPFDFSYTVSPSDNNLGTAQFSLSSDFSLSSNADFPTTSPIYNVFTGTKVQCNFYEVNNDGEVGSDIVAADDDLYHVPTRDDLLGNGFVSGYPNTGSYPYCISIYRNDSVLEKFYFNEIPYVSTDYTSDTLIRYNVNMDNTKGYIYFPEQDCSSSFDFTSDDSRNSFIASQIYKFLSNLNGIDTTDFNNTYSFHCWSNFVTTGLNGTDDDGRFHSSYFGYRVKFNWDLDKSGKFQRNDSEDTHNYGNDFEPDIPFTDNNGYIHGGGNSNSSGTGSGGIDDLTHSSSGANSIITFMSSFSSVLSNFFNFLKTVLSFFPPYIWIAVSFSIIASVISKNPQLVLLTLLISSVIILITSLTGLSNGISSIFGGG